MIAALFVVWTLIALVVGIVIGKGIATADRREQPKPKPNRYWTLERPAPVCVQCVAKGLDR